MTQAAVCQDPVAEPLIPASFRAGRAWHVVYTNIKCEKRARMGIEEKGFEAFLPVEKKQSIVRGRRTEVIRPLFSRYVFVSFDIERDPWHDVKRVDGVEALVMNNSLPVRVPNQAIEALRSAMALGAFDRTTRAATLKAGDLVSIVDGPFRDFVAEVADASDKKRVEIMLKLFGTERTISVDLEQIRAVG
jgi:transcriptional antiterminator RfaH